MKPITKVIFFNISFWILIPISLSQGVYFDSLSKYSYFILGRTTEGKAIQATCFLLRKGDNLFLTTAAHVLGGWENNPKNLISTYPDILYIRVFTKRQGRPVLIPFRIEHLKGYIMDVGLDLGFYHINIPDSFMTFSLEKSLDDVNWKSSLSQPIEINGYPIIDSTDNIDEIMFGQPPQKVRGNIYVEKWIDKNSAIFPVLINNNGSIRKGSSGSPSLFIYEKEKSFSFGGMVVQSSNMGSIAYIVRPDIIRDRFFQLPNPK